MIKRRVSFKEFKRQVPALSARKLRAIESGKFKGIKSTKSEIKAVKTELRRRGLRIRL